MGYFVFFLKCHFLFFGGFFCFLFFNVTRKKYPKRLRAYVKRLEIIECESIMTRLPPVWLFFKKSKIGHSCSVWRRVVTGYLKNRFFFSEKRKLLRFFKFCLLVGLVFISSYFVLCLFFFAFICLFVGGFILFSNSLDFVLFVCCCFLFFICFCYCLFVIKQYVLTYVANGFISNAIILMI